MLSQWAKVPLNSLGKVFSFSMWTTFPMELAIIMQHGYFTGPLQRQPPQLYLVLSQKGARLWHVSEVARTCDKMIPRINDVRYFSFDCSQICAMQPVSLVSFIHVWRSSYGVETGTCQLFYHLLIAQTTFEDAVS